MTRAPIPTASTYRCCGGALERARAQPSPVRQRVSRRRAAWTLCLGSPILDIGGGRPQQGGIVIEASEPGIALAAEQGAQFARAMAVIDAQRLVRFFLQIAQTPPCRSSMRS